MLIGKVVGSAVATLKDQRLEGTKLLLVSPADAHGEAVAAPFLALDLVGAGEGELVMVVQGSAARAAVGPMSTPVDAAIVGILDLLRFEEAVSFRKG